jgi:hypothetical protein
MAIMFTFILGALAGATFTCVIIIIHDDIKRR